MCSSRTNTVDLRISFLQKTANAHPSEPCTTAQISIEATIQQLALTGFKIPCDYCNNFNMCFGLNDQRCYGSRYRDIHYNNKVIPNNIIPKIIHILFMALIYGKGATMRVFGEKIPKRSMPVFSKKIPKVLV